MNRLPIDEQAENAVVEAIMAGLPLTELRSVGLRGVAFLPDRPGVYVVTDGSGTALYVGQSLSLRTRWRAHNRLPEVGQFLGVRVVWSETGADEALRIETERMLIARLAPFFNGKRELAPRADWKEVAACLRL